MLLLLLLLLIQAKHIMSSSSSSSDISENYSLKAEAAKVLAKLINDPALQFSQQVQDYAAQIQYKSYAGIDKPIIPSSLKFTESSAGIWGAIGALSQAIVAQRYGAAEAAQRLDNQVVVDLDRATTNLISVGLVSFDDNKTFLHPEVRRRWVRYDKKENLSELYRTLVTNIYQTKDGKYFHLHGGMDSDATLTMLGLPLHNKEISKDRAQVVEFFNNECKKYDSEWLDVTSNERYRQTGAVCLTQQEFAQTEHGKILNQEPVFGFEKVNASLPPVEWPAAAAAAVGGSGAGGAGGAANLRPLEGINVLDVSRVIAAPQISKYLAFLGANVVRVSSDKNPDMAILLFDGNLGKKDTTIDLKTEAGKKTLDKLIQDADVFIDGFRPNAIAKLGFSQQYVQYVAKKRNKGIVFARENCYGYKGPWAHRSGWQQISDCITGVTWEHGKFLGLDEPVIPVFPNADYQVAFLGVVGILNGLYKRNLEGGSYNVDLSLTQYDIFLLRLGLLPPQEQQRLKEEASKDENPETSLLKLRHHHDMTILIPKAVIFFKKLYPALFRKESFGVVESGWADGGAKETMNYLKSPLELGNVDLSPSVGSYPIGTFAPDWNAQLNKNSASCVVL